MSNGHNVLKIMHIGAKVGQRLVMSLSDVTGLPFGLVASRMSARFRKRLGPAH